MHNHNQKRDDSYNFGTERKCSAQKEDIAYERTIGYFPIFRGKQRRILCHQFTLYLMASAEQHLRASARCIYGIWSAVFMA